ncbi:hypothetical protein C0J52_10556 [Blattella germanica]|nr:hypothetical protein C0J52_10556 [Blattella germanica]
MAPVLTPFANDKNFSVKLDVIPAYAKYLASIGIEAVLEAWAAAVKKTEQVLMVQVGGACLKDVQELAAHAEQIGSDGLLCLPELYFKPTTEEDLVSYLKQVGEAAPTTPLLYYHIPSLSGVKVNMPKFMTIAAREIPTFGGIKFTDTNLDEASQCLLVENGSLGLFLGCDQVLAGAFTLGIDSAIATTLNMIPSPSIKMKNAIKNNRPDEALEQQKILNKAIAAMTLNGKYAAVRQ